MHSVFGWRYLTKARTGNLESFHYLDHMIRFHIARYASVAENADQTLGI
jgi:hypothetical protein